MKQNYLSAAMAKSIASDLADKKRATITAKAASAITRLNKSPITSKYKRLLVELKKLETQLTAMAETQAAAIGARIRFNDYQGYFHYSGPNRDHNYYVDDIAARLQIEFNINGKTLDQAKVEALKV